MPVLALRAPGGGSFWTASAGGSIVGGRLGRIAGGGRCLTSAPPGLRLVRRAERPEGQGRKVESRFTHRNGITSEGPVDGAHVAKKLGGAGRDARSCRALRRRVRPVSPQRAVPLSRDGGRLWYAPLQGETAQKLRELHPEIPTTLETVVLVDNGRAYVRSKAFLYVSKYLTAPVAVGLSRALAAGVPARPRLPPGRAHPVSRVGQVRRVPATDDRRARAPAPVATADSAP